MSDLVHARATECAANHPDEVAADTRWTRSRAVILLLVSGTVGWAGIFLLVRHFLA